MQPIWIDLASYVLVGDYKGRYGIFLFVPSKKGEGKLNGVGGVQYRHRFCCEDHQDKASNNRELRYLVEVVEEVVYTISMEGVDIFFLVENSVTEAFYYQVNSINEDIF